MIKEFDYTHNLVTNDGEVFYAKAAAGETQAATEDFGGDHRKHVINQYQHHGNRRQPRQRAQ